MENSLVVLLLLDKKQEIKFWWYHAQVTASLWILCNILENIPHALDVHAKRVLKYNFIFIYDFTIIETGGFNVFL
jgi:hypothetical protein